MLEQRHWNSTEYEAKVIFGVTVFLGKAIACAARVDWD